MLFFENDYSTATHPEILKRIGELNLEKLSGYGCDKVSESAREKIRKVCQRDDLEIFFLVGGTQTNAVMVNSILRAYEGVVAVTTGHISTHEAGAIEYTGHKVLTIPQHQGKMNPDELKDYLVSFYNDDLQTHSVYPGAVYVSHPTEYGTLYTKAELEKISSICKEYEIPFILDGARLGYGVSARETDVTMADIARLCDVFYIGGTKLGALFGEALVYKKENCQKHFSTFIKTHGALLAKGYVTGAQFDEFFTNDLYFKAGKHAIDMAAKLQAGLKVKGYKFYFESPTNLQFPILENEKVEELLKEVVFSFREKYDDNHTIIRLVTDWSTKEEDVDKLLELF